MFEAVSNKTKPCFRDFNDERISWRNLGAVAS
jgi:hypothetical protein